MNFVSKPKPTPLWNSNIINNIHFILHEVYRHTFDTSIKSEINDNMHVIVGWWFQQQSCSLTFGLVTYYQLNFSTRQLHNFTKAHTLSYNYQYRSVFQEKEMKFNRFKTKTLKKLPRTHRPPNIHHTKLHINC